MSWGTLKGVWKVPGRGEFGQVDFGQPVPTSSAFRCSLKNGIHIRFFFSTETLPRLLVSYIYDQKATYGSFTSFGQQASPEPRQSKVIVELSSPNIVREFTAAHLVRVNYLGD